MLGLAICTSALADQEPDVSPPSRSIASIGASYQFEHDRDIGVNGQGVGGDFAVDLFPHVFIDGSYSRVRTQTFREGHADGRLQYDTAGASLGGYVGIGEKADLTATVGYELFGSKGLEGLAPNNPQHWRGGLITSLTGSYTFIPHLSAFLGGGYSVVGRNRGIDGTAGLSLDLLKYLTLDAGYWAASKADGFSAGLRVRFGD